MLQPKQLGDAQSTFSKFHVALTMGGLSALRWRGLCKTLTVVLGCSLISLEAAALGLGNLQMQSNLDQPLNALIELRVSPGDDVSSITAKMATREEFENLGVDYAEYVGNMTIELEQATSGSVLRVTSNDVIIREPFIHFLVRVNWSGGSFLREYTALIDPPTYSSQAPRSVAAPSAVGGDQAYSSESRNVSATDLDDPALDSDPYKEAPVVTPADPAYGTEGVAVEVVDGVTEYTAAGDGAQQARRLPTDAQYGPVASGESLGAIAEDLQRQFPDLSIYQIMKVLFEENPDAFINGNINGLIKGAVLNIGDLDAIRAVKVSDGRRFFQAQLSDWEAIVGRSSSSDGNDGLSVAADAYTGQDDYLDSRVDARGSSSRSGGSTDSFQVGSSSDVGTYVSSNQGGSNDGEVIALRSQLTELETSLSSSRLENQELAERISILEQQLADMNRLMELSVENAELASLEAALAQQNAKVAAAEAEQAVSAGNERFEELASELVDPADVVYEDEVVQADTAPLTGTDELDSVVTPEPVSVTVSEPVATPEAGSADVVSLQGEAGFFDKLKDTLMGDGLWRVGAAAGAIILGFLGLFIIRRRRADEEFEISMLSIGSHSQTIDDFATKPVSDLPPGAVAAATAAPAAAAAAAAVDGGGDRDTSFLTVYTDTDAVVQADEVDPIAEADVYIAYGRDEQAEEVLLDGVASYPNRADIKHKLLNLYHKNTNVEGFERLAEELYAQRGSLSASAWQDVVRMGKNIAPENPIFELSSEEIETANKVVNELDDEADFADEPIVADQVVEDEPAPAASLDEPPADQIDANTEQAIVEAEAEAAAIAAEVAQAEATIERATQNAPDNAFEPIHDDVVENEEDGAEIRFVEEGDESSINLINFDDGRSEMSELDEVELEALSRATEAEIVSDSALAFELPSNMKTGAQSKAPTEPKDDADVSDFEVDPNYDEARTQYELAKVFIDLGDEDGARKILDEILENKDNNESVMADASALLETISG